MSAPEKKTNMLPPLTEDRAGPEPLALFGEWYGAAQGAGIPLPNAMTLAIVGPEGRPSSRVVLLKGFDDSGFTFFTNFRSRKARELAANSHAALVMYWTQLDRQIRIEG